MYLYVGTLTFLLLVDQKLVKALPSQPVHVTIDCSSNEKEKFGRTFPGSQSLLGGPRSLDVDSFCSLIQQSIPKAVKDGKFILAEPEYDQMGFSDTQIPIFTSPPQGSPIPDYRLKILRPSLRIPKINIPKLRGNRAGPLAPRIGPAMVFSRFRGGEDEETSAEKMERFKKGVQKMLHVVKVLGQIDQYLSERTRIVVEKLSKTLAE